MSEASQKLSESLKLLHQLQTEGNKVIQTHQLSRTHRERLCRHGFLQEVTRGWYISSRPDEIAGESTAWYTSFWSFCSTYLEHTKQGDWHLSAEQSILLHAGNWTVPKQLLVRSTKASNKIISLPHNTSLLNLQSTTFNENKIDIKHGIKILSLPAALCACSKDFFHSHPTDCQAAMMTISDSSDLLRILLNGGHSVIAGRLAGAFRSIGQDQIADDIIDTMKKADHAIRESNPFQKAPPIILKTKETSPHINRVKLLWQDMRPHVLTHFPKSPGLPKDIKQYLASVESSYITDAYHSLSIEGYHVTEGLIERVQTRQWQPDLNNKDTHSRDAMAARGYWQAYKSVESSIQSVLNGKAASLVAERDHRKWYRDMFAPAVAAALIEPEALAGYRAAPVYIRQSMHIPPHSDAVRELMPALFELLAEEKEASVRAVLGHFIFVYIHPYMDGNGRMGRFLMNLMLASGGYPWLVIPVEKRDEYMSTLESASVDKNIKPFAEFLGALMQNKLPF